MADTELDVRLFKVCKAMIKVRKHVIVDDVSRKFFQRVLEENLRFLCSFLEILYGCTSEQNASVPAKAQT